MLRLQSASGLVEQRLALVVVLHSFLQPGPALLGVPAMARASFGLVLTTWAPIRVPAVLLEDLVGDAEVAKVRVSCLWWSKLFA